MRSRQVLFIQGGGAGAHDDWDDKLVDSLRGALGDGYVVLYPRMPAEDDPGYGIATAYRSNGDLREVATVIRAG